MLKTLLITTAVSGLIVSGATAQSQTPTAPAPTEQSTAPKDQSTVKESTSASETEFVPSQSADQWVFTKFKGSDVIGPDNASIGSVSDLLFDRTGKIIGVVVGVGGFLGIGTKDVAINMSAFNVMPADTGNKDNAPTGNANDPTMVKLKVAWTKDQLKEAPDFQYYKPPVRTGATPSPTTTGQAPRPMAPATPRPQTQ
jgi:PRC-barrel domain